jgi:hypothetical protein
MCSPLGFAIQSFLKCFLHSQKMAFVSEFQHTPVNKIVISSMLHTSRGLEISCACI